MSAARLPTSVLVHIQGEPFLTRAREHIAATLVWSEAWSAFAESRGAQGHTYGMSGLNFGRRKPPEGWTKPDGKYGWSRPKKGHPDVGAMKTLPRCPSAWDVFRDHFINTLSHKGPDGFGSGSISGHWSPADLGWIGDDLIYARVPHPANAAANVMADYPGHTITTPGAVDWTMPVGLVIVSQAQVDLWHAQAEFDTERVSVTTPQAVPLPPTASSGEEETMEK